MEEAKDKHIKIHLTGFDEPSFQKIAHPIWTMYDENNNNMVWSHLWGQWTGTSNRTGKEWSNPFHASFKWVDGKIVSSNWIYDPTSENEEMAAMK